MKNLQQLKEEAEKPQMKGTKEKLIKHIFKSACGYGMADKDGKGYNVFKQCMECIPEEHFDDFIYTLKRIAEKSGQDGFSSL